MNTRIDLPSGEWIEFRDANDVTERLRRPVVVRVPKAAMLAAQVAGLDATDPNLDIDVDVAFIREFNDLVAMCFIAAWSFDLPVAIDSLLDLPAPAYDAITDYSQQHASDLYPAASAAT